MIVNDDNITTHVESTEGRFVSQKEANRPQKCQEVYRLSMDNAVNNIARTRRCNFQLSRTINFPDGYVSLFKFLTVPRALSTILTISIYTQEERGFAAYRKRRRGEIIIAFPSCERLS